MRVVLKKSSFFYYFGIKKRVNWNKQAYHSKYFYANPSAGIGRQGELKIR
jgi:hypothetical protein